MCDALIFRNPLCTTVRKHAYIDSVIFDLHNDLPTARLSVKDRVKTVSYYGKDDRIVLAVWTTRLHDPVRTIAVRLAQNRKPFDCTVLFAIEDIGFVEAYGDETLSEIPLVYTGLTWNFDNALAGGAYGQNGLTAFGKKVIARLNDDGVCVDTAHLNEKSFWTAIDYAAHPIVSHTACSALCPSKRNISDVQLRAIAARGGLIGITAAQELGVTSIDCFVDNVVHAASVAGMDSVAIGTDMFGATMPQGLQTYEQVEQVAERFLQRGFTQKNVEQIFYANAARYFGDGTFTKERKHKGRSP